MKMAGRPLRQIVEAIIDRDLSPGAQSRVISGFAKRVLKETIAHNQQASGREPIYEQFVDGAAGAALERVKPNGGRIIFRFDVTTREMFAWIYEMLMKHAPQKTGHYSESFLLFAGERQIDPTEILPPASDYTFINRAPYSRKIEKGLSPKAPDGVFEAVAAIAAQKYGDVANVKFTYRSLQEYGIQPYVPIGDGHRRARDQQGRFAKSAARSVDLTAARQRERETRTPAIFVELHRSPIAKPFRPL